VIESLELITASKQVFTLLRFILFNCGLRSDAFGTVAMYSRTIVLLANNTLRKKGNVDYKARYYARIFLETGGNHKRRHRVSIVSGQRCEPFVRNMVQDDM